MSHDSFPGFHWQIINSCIQQYSEIDTERTLSSEINIMVSDISKCYRCVLLDNIRILATVKTSVYT